MFNKLTTFITDIAKGLYYGPDNKSISQTKFWSNAAYAVGLGKFATLANPSPEIWMIVLGVIGAHAAYSKTLDLKNLSNSSGGDSNGNADESAN